MFMKFTFRIGSHVNMSEMKQMSSDLKCFGQGSLERNSLDSTWCCGILEAVFQKDPDSRRLTIMNSTVLMRDTWFLESTLFLEDTFRCLFLLKGKGVGTYS